MLTYKFRLLPNHSQSNTLWLHANKLNYLYNYFLNQKITNHQNNIKTTKFDQQKELVTLKKQDDILKSIHSQVLQSVTNRLDKTFKTFFRSKFGFPKFRPCRNFFGILYPQSGFTIKDNLFITKQYGTIKFYKHRDYLGKIKQVYIKCDNKNKWNICITTDYVLENNNKQDRIIGIDLGISNIVSLSNGKIIKNNRHQKYFDKQINKLKARKDKLCRYNQKKTRFYKFLTKRINTLYEMKNNKITDFLHKISKYLSLNYDTIIIENLKLKNMSEGKAKGLNRELRNSCLGQLINYLKYKCHKIIEINPKNTSKTCNNCGQIHNMKLSDRTMICNCGNTIDRDVNAAKNIYLLGTSLLNLDLECTLTINDILIVTERSPCL